MASYSSDFINEFNLDEDTLTDRLIELINYPCDTGEASYSDIIILYGDKESYKVLFNSDSVYGVQNLYSSDNCLMEHLISVINNKIEERELQRLKKEKEERDKLNEKEKAREIQLKKDRELYEKETYERLKKKFGD